MSVFTWEDVQAVKDLLKAKIPGLVYIEPSDPRREFIVGALSLLNKLSGNSWSAEYARENVSTALPAFGKLIPDVLRGVPIAGPLLTQLVSGFDYPTISLSPAALRSPDTAIAALTHEGAHQYGVASGGIEYCVKYVVYSEQRALGSEIPAYACDLAWATWLNGADPMEYAAVVAQAAKSYGASKEHIADAERMLQGHALSLKSGICPPIQVLIDTVKLLRSRGHSWLPEVP